MDSVIPPVSYVNVHERILVFRFAVGDSIVVILPRFHLCSSSAVFCANTVFVAVVLFNTLPNVSKFPSFTSAIPFVTVNVTCFYLVGTTRAVALIPTGFDGIWKLNQARERREKVRGERKRMTTTTTRRFFFSTSRSFVHHHYRTTARARILLQFCLFFSVFFWSYFCVNNARTKCRV